MRVIKPNWVEHTGGEKKAKCPVYSMSVHPDGTRLATGGMDRKIKIWSTLPILDPEAEKVEENHKLLCTMSEHTGSVLAVRWAHHGRFLASGSDDQVGMIWGLDPDGGGRLWGSDEVNVEKWKPLTRLVAHVADIIDMAWSRDDSMLASVGLDSTVWIWDGRTFDRIKKLDKHEGFVKGVCWDPVGNFLATQSDDKTVKIWNTDTWELVQSVAEPFAGSGHATFFRRLSWSPDGAFIAASNAKNGPVFVATCIFRDEWTHPISFVGHANTIQVASFNPRLFFPPGQAATRGTASCMLALGADDFSISIWRNTAHVPLVVLNNLFEHSLLDLCWSNDGHHLYGCSEDGTVCAISFDDEEIPDLGTPAQTELILAEYDYVPQQRRIAPPPSVVSNGFGGASAAASGVVNVIQARKAKPGDQRRRINLPNSSSSADPNVTSNALAGPSRAPLARPRLNGPSHGEGQDNEPSVFDAPIEQFASPSQAQASTARMFRDAGSAFGQGRAVSPSKTGGKRRADALYDDRAPKGRMMGGGVRREADVREIRAARIPQAEGAGGTQQRLPTPVIQATLRAKPREGKGGAAADGAMMLEARNAGRAGEKNMLSYTVGEEDVWVDYLPSPAVALAVGGRCAAVGCENGQVVVYSSAGRHLLNLRIPHMPVEISISGHHVAILTDDCNVRVYSAKTGKTLCTPTSCGHLLDSSTATPFEIIHFDVHPTGAVVIQTSEPAAYALDPFSTSWIPLITPFQVTGSPISGSAGPLGPRGPLARIEKNLRDAAQLASVPRTERPEWWDEALTLGHLEMRIKGAEALGSGEEWVHWVKEYARYVGKEGFEGRAEEMIKELMGPLGISAATNEWRSEVDGVTKRSAARQVVDILAQSENLGSLAAKYDSIIRLVQSG